jgi:hypothetical protein
MLKHLSCISKYFKKNVKRRFDAQLKKRVIVLLILLIVFVASAITGYNLYSDYKHEQRRLNDAYHQVSRTYNETLEDLNAFYASRSKMIIDMPSVMDAFQ